MISLYTKPARTAADKEEWIRKQALMVLVYEAIVKKALDFDYAPASEIVEGRRVYFNTSQVCASPRARDCACVCVRVFVCAWRRPSPPRRCAAAAAAVAALPPPPHPASIVRRRTGGPV